MKNQGNTMSKLEDEVAQPTYTQLERWLIGITSVSFFPLTYLIGKTMVAILK